MEITDVENLENVEDVERYEELKSCAIYYESSSEEESVGISEDEEELQSLEEGESKRKIEKYELILELPFNFIWKGFLHSSILLHSAILLTFTGLRYISHEKYRKDTLSFMLYFYAFDAFYFMDFTLALVYRLCRDLNVTRAFELRPFWQLGLDIFSLIPIETLYIYVWPAINWRLFEFLYFNRLLRQYFLIDYILKSRAYIEYQTVRFRLWEFFTMLLSSCHFLLAWLLGGTDCEFKSLEGCNDTWTYYYVEDTLIIGGPRHIQLEHMYEWYWIALYVVISKLTTNGIGGELEHKSIKECLVYIVTAFISIVLRIVIIITPLILVVVFQKSAIFDYFHTLKVLINYLKEQKIDDVLVQRVKDSYEEFWVRSQGIKGMYLPRWLSPLAKRMVCLDVYWNSYKHSHLFRDMDPPFLRYLSIFFTSEFYMPGDIIYRKHDLKSRMIYVVTGVIQVLSEEDDQTEIMSFTTGTCIGEITLFMSYQTTTILRSATYSELYIFERKTVCSEMNSYPLHHRSLIYNAMRRIEEAKRLVNISQQIKNQIESTMHMKTSLAWLKKNLDELITKIELEKKLGKNDNQKLKEEKNIILTDISIYEEVQHKAQYLDLYNITKTLEYDTERACLTGKFPWILKPESPFLIVWERIILATIMILAIIIPHNATYKTSEETCITVLLITILLLFDIFIQLTTAIRTEEGLIMNVRTIIYKRFLKPGFLVDLIGSIPIELIVLILKETGSEYDLFSKLQINRLFRLWRFESYFVNMENSLHVAVRIVRLIKYSIYTCLVIYIYACLMYWETCPYSTNCYPSGWITSWVILGILDDHKFGVPMFFSANIITGLGLNNVQPTDLADIKFIMLGSVLSSMLFIYMISGAIACNILSKYRWYAFLELSKRIQRFMLTGNLDQGLKYRVEKFLNHEWQHNNSSNLIKGGIMFNMQQNLKNEIHIAMCASLLKRVRLFQEVSNEFITKLATVAEVNLVPAQEIVAYAGSINFDLHIIQDGYSEIISSLDKSLNRTIGPGSYFGEIEMYLQIPVTDTVRTITNCKIIKITSLMFNKVICSYPSLKEECIFFVNEVNAIKEKGRRKVAVQYTEYTQINIQAKSKSFYNFGSKLLRNSVSGQNYFKPFEKLKLLQFIRCFLLRSMVLPDGLFVKIWEVLRCIFAFLSCLFYPAQEMLIASNLDWLANFNYLFDITAYIDMYVRLHICYYTKEGILIYHPLKTATYYIKHGFILDFLGCIPLEIFFPSKTAKEKSVRGCITYLRLLQMHRIVSGILYKEYDSKMNHVLQALKYCPILIIVVNVICTILLKVNCKFDREIEESALFMKGVNCTSWNWLVNSNYVRSATRKLYPAETYLLGLYFSISILSRTGLPGVVPGSYEDYIVVTVFAIFGLMFTVAFYGAIASAKSNKSPDLTYYQENIKTLTKFMKIRKIPKDIRHDIINYFEVLWKTRKGLDPHIVLKSFRSCLRNDILYSLYGSPLTVESIFSGTNISFFYNFLNFSRTEFYLHKSFIFDINDISTRLYVIIRGKALVMSADGNRIAVLHPGSLFGNLQNNKSSRQAISVMAKGNLDVLWIETGIFYQILTHYSQMKKKFDLITHRFVDFVPSLSVLAQLDTDVEKDEYQYDFSVVESVPSILLQKGVIFPNSVYYKIWEFVAKVLGPIITYILVLYQISLNDYTYHLFGIGIFFDLIYLARPFIKTRLAYENEAGDTVLKKPLIRQRYIFSLLGLALDVITIPPIEVFGFIAPSKYRLYYIALLRINRLPRVFLLNEFFEMRKNKLNINVFFLRIFSMTVRYLLAVHTMACLHLKMTCRLEKCEITGVVFENRHHAYLLILQNTLQITTTAAFYSHMGQDIKMLIYYIFVAIITMMMGAFIIGEIYSTLVMATFSIGKYVHSINKMRMSVIKNNLSPSLVKRLWIHVVNLWNFQRGHHYPKLLAKAPACLRQKINTYLYENHLQQCHVFYHCDVDLLRQITLTMKEILYFPGNMIVLEGDIDNCMYFIHSGEVQILSQGNFLDQQVGILKAGDTFGLEQGLIDRKPHSYTYCARTISVIVSLKKKKWEHLLDFYPAAKESIKREVSYFT